MASSLKDFLDKHFKVVVGGSSAGGNKRLECLHCCKQFSGSATRQKYHLLGVRGKDVLICANCPAEVEEELRALEENIASNKRPRLQSFALTSSQSVNLSSQASSCQTATAERTNDIRDALKKQNKEDVDLLVAQLFYQAALPFNIVRNGLWKKVLEAIGKFGPSYTGPSYNGLRTTQMAKAKEKVAAYLSEWFKAAERTGIVVLSDGWTDMCSRPIINILGSSPKGAYFISAPDVSAAPEKNAQFLYEMWAKVIEDLGQEKVFAMITDGAAVNKAAGALLEERFPHLTWVHCTSHALDLCLEDICKLEPFADAIREAKQCLHFITKHQRSHAIYRQQKDHKELLRPGETRFYTAHIMLARMLEMKEVLQRTVVSPEWTEWANKPAYREQAAEVKTILLDDTRGGFWSRSAQAVEIFEPIVKLLRLCDADYPTMGKVYYYCSLMDPRIRASSLSPSLKADCCKIFRKRWDAFNSILHCAAFAVDPEFVDIEMNAEVMAGFRSICKKILPDLPTAGKAVMQLATFRNKEGSFADTFQMEMERESPAYQWWQMNGVHCPELCKVAMIVLAMVSSAGACERNWSAHDVIQTKKRNRLDPKRLEDLVHLYCNLRLINKMRTDELFAEWDEE